MARRCLWQGLPVLLVAFLAVCLASKTAFGVATWTLVAVLPAALFGSQAVGSSLAQLASLRAPGMLATLPADEAGWLCRAASLFHEHVKAFVILTAENQRAFELACRRVMPSLEREARRELEQMLHTGLLGQALLGLPLTPQNAHMDSWSTCGAAWSHKAEHELEGMEVELFQRTGMRPLKERVVEASEVQEALRRAENVRFDARGLLPARMFNTSMQELHALHADHDIVVHATSDEKHGREANTCWLALWMLTNFLVRGGPGSLLEWLTTQGMMEGLLSMLCSKDWTLKDLAARLQSFQPLPAAVWQNQIERFLVGAHYQDLANRGLGLLSSNINALRLPNWTMGAADPQLIAEKLGLGQQVEHAFSLLWLGAATGGLHSDIQDNVLVQLTGESDVVMIPANCSFALDIGAGFGVPHADWFKEKGADLPFFLVKLRAGDGLAIPSNSVHSVLVQDPKRIGLNFFFEPRYGQMQWPSSPANFYNYAGRGHLAMRALWLKTLKELWQTKKPGEPSFVLHGQRQELI